MVGVDEVVRSGAVDRHGDRRPWPFAGLREIGYFLNPHAGGVVLAQQVAVIVVEIPIDARGQAGGALAQALAEARMAIGFSSYFIETKMNP